MATLTGTKVKDTYQSLLKLESGTLSSTYKVVEDGQGNDAGLKISTSGVEVEALKFTTDPSSSSSELTALVYDGSTKEVKVRDLNAAAFSGGLSPAIIVAAVESDYTYTTSYAVPTIAGVDNDAAGASYQFGSGGELTLDSGTAKITINTDGVYRISLSAQSVTTNASRTLTFKLLKGTTTVFEVEREKSAAGTYFDHWEYISYFRAADEIKFQYKASGSGCTLKAASYFEVQQIK